MSKLMSAALRLIAVMMMAFGSFAFISVPAASAAPKKDPPKPVSTYESLQDEAVAGANAETATFTLHALMMGSGDARLVIENVSGTGTLTGTLKTEGKAAFEFSVALKDAPYPGIVIARKFAPKGQDVHWLVFFNGATILDQTSAPFKGVVHLWAELNPSNPCEVEGFFKEDPGIDAQVDQQQPIHEWFSASEGSFGKFIVTTDGWHELKATAGRSKKLEADGTFGDKRGRLSFKWFANCGKTETPVVSCDNVDPRAVALKPGEQVEFTLTGTNAVSYKFEMGGKKVSETDKYVFTAKEVGTYNLTGFIAGEDGKFVGDDNCNAQIVVSEKTTNVVSCDDVDPRAVALKPGEEQEFTLTGTNAVAYQILMGKKVVSHTATYIFKAVEVGVYDLTGQVAGQNGKFVSGDNCIARVVVTNNTDTPRSRIWPTGMPIVGCQSLPQYGNEAVWVKAYSLIHINTENRPAGERWDVVQSSFSADGLSWTTTPTPTRVIGIESRSIPMEQVVWVNFLASQQNADVATFGDTHLLRDSLPGVDPLNYEQVRRLGFHIVHPDQPERLLGPARKGTDADAEYEWAYKVNVARCAPKTDTPMLISKCVGLNPDGTKKYEEFPLGQEPEEAADCSKNEQPKKNYCERIDGVDVDRTIDADTDIPVHLPCTLGEIDEAEAAEIARIAALWATLAIFLIFFGVLIASRRRFASAKTR